MQRAATITRPATNLQHVRCAKRERQQAVSVRACAADTSVGPCNKDNADEALPRISHCPATAVVDHSQASVISRRDLLRGAMTGTIANSAPIVMLDIAHVQPAEAVPNTLNPPPIGQAAPGTSNLGVAAMRDPALYRSGGRNPADLQCCWDNRTERWGCIQGLGNRASCQEQITYAWSDAISPCATATRD